MPFTAFHMTQQGQLQQDLSESEIVDAYASKQGLLWVDIGDTTGEDGEFLARVFDFHELAIQGCVSLEIRPPKVDDHGDHLFILVQGINYAIDSEFVETAELAIFLGRYFVVTAHNFPLYSVDSVKGLAGRGMPPMRRGADFLAHALIDSLINNIIPTIDVMSERMDEIEEEAIGSPQPATLDRMLKLKRSILRVHRRILPQREVLNRLSRGDFEQVGADAGIYYRNVYDQITRIEDVNQSLRERADNAVSVYLSSIANRQNETMKMLAVIAAIFLPLTLLAGLYGMNFENMPELGWKYAYFVVLGIISAVGISTLVWFFGRGWLVWGGRQITSRVRPFVVEAEHLIGYAAPVAHTLEKATIGQVRRSPNHERDPRRGKN